MLRDFFTGTIGAIIEVILLLGGIGLLLGGLFGGSGLGIVIGIILICMAAGARYALRRR